MKFTSSVNLILCDIIKAKAYGITPLVSQEASCCDMCLIEPVQEALIKPTWRLHPKWK